MSSVSGTPAVPTVNNLFKGTGALVIGLMMAVFPDSAFAFDNDAAKKAFKKCAACHKIGPDAKNTIGPQLNGLDSRQIGSITDFRYSNVLKQAGSEGRVWDSETLDQFLLKPKALFKGTKMSFGGIRKDDERQNLVAWLLHFDAAGKELSDKADANGSNILLGASAAAMEGDVEYGQYLSGECVTCHKAGADDDGIPSIVGWPKENFIHALYLYKTEKRENPVMRTVTKRLTDEEMAALAAYFGALEQE